MHEAERHSHPCAQMKWGTLPDLLKNDTGCVVVQLDLTNQWLSDTRPNYSPKLT